jgi:U3 small nucleolar RNA-associated protein 22
LTYFRELTLLKQQLGSDGILRVRDNVESQRLEKESLLLPQLTSTLHSFHREYAAFGTTCRLAKRWLASHLLLASPMQYNRNPDQQDCRFSEESVELLVAHLFMDFAPYLSPPNEAQLGFLRFLHLISKTDWRSTAIILNFHEKLTSAEVSAVELDFVKRRDQLPCIFICTPDDKSASVWTKPLAPVTVNRAKVLASRALILLEDVLVKETKKYNSGSADLKDDLRTIFRHDESRYDVLIKLKKEMNPRRTEHMDSSTRLKYMEYSRTPNELMPIVDFDPVQLYLQELRDTYGHLALFLHDTYGGSYIAVVWKPDVYQEQNFSVSLNPLLYTSTKTSLVLFLF